MSEDLVVIRSASEAVEHREAWQSLPIDHPHADLDFFLAVVEARSEVYRPHAVLVLDEGRPSALVAARLEATKLVTSFGYRAVYSPRVRALTVVPGGDLVTQRSAAEELVESLLGSLRAGEADVVVFPSLRRDSTLFIELSRAVGSMRRSHFADVRTHRRLRLPANFDEFLATRKRKVRAGVRYDAKRLERQFTNRLRVERFASAGDFDRIFEEIPRIAELTYQRGLGAGFSDTPERRRLVRLSLEKGWFRAWVLYVDATPVAFWQGLVYRGVYHSATTGYDPEYGRDRVGIYLLMRVIADLCADSDVDLLDFGYGDAEYKRHFSDESWSEGDLLIFAPTIRARTINVVRTVVMGAATEARRILERVGMTDRVKTAWRRRIRKQA